MMFASRSNSGEPSIRNPGLKRSPGPVAKNPLLFQPGTAWNYGVSTDVLGHLIEIWSRQDLDEYLRTKVLGPLGMNDTR